MKKLNIDIDAGVGGFKVTCLKLQFSKSEGL